MCSYALFQFVLVTSPSPAQLFKVTLPMTKTPQDVGSTLGFLITHLKIEIQFRYAENITIGTLHLRMCFVDTTENFTQLFVVSSVDDKTNRIST